MNTNWSAWNWFGLQFGCSAWMLVFGASLFGLWQVAAGAICAVALAVHCVVSTTLWRAQRSLTIERARILSFAFYSITTPVVWSCVTMFASADFLRALRWPSTWQTGLFVFSIFPILIACYAAGILKSNNVGSNFKMESDIVQPCDKSRNTLQSRNK